MKKWSTVNDDKLMMIIKGLEGEMFALCGMHIDDPRPRIFKDPSKSANYSVAKATREALVHVHNCLNVGDE